MKRAALFILLLTGCSAGHEAPQHPRAEPTQTSSLGVAIAAPTSSQGAPIAASDSRKLPLVGPFVCPASPGEATDHYGTPFMSARASRVCVQPHARYVLSPVRMWADAGPAWLAVPPQFVLVNRPGTLLAIDDELTRVAVPETEEEWLAWARGRRVCQIEQAVSARRPGDRPRSRPDRGLVKHRLRFEVRAETMALMRDVQARIRAELGGELDDDAFLYELARRALGGPTDEGRASYQVAVTRCPDCGTTSIEGGGQSHVVDEAVSAMVACDCQEVGAGDPSPHVGATPKAAGEDAPGTSPPRARATQSIPPAVRRLVRRRHGNRCAVPGCQSSRFLDLHHTRPRAEGGTHDPDHLILTCGSHHRAAHTGALVIGGDARTGFTFQHADGTPYGGPLRPRAVELAEQTFDALCKLGFPQTRARTLLEQALAEAQPLCSLAALLERALLLA
jgi:hypothetical protein